MKTALSWVALGGLLALAACTDQQNDLRKAGYDTIQAYNAVAPLALVYVRQSTTSTANRAAVKAASARAMPVITTLGADLQSPTPVTALEVSAAEAAVAALESSTAGATK